jgi:hypothetical protein
VPALWRLQQLRRLLISLHRGEGWAPLTAQQTVPIWLNRPEFCCATDRIEVPCLWLRGRGHGGVMSGTTAAELGDCASADASDFPRLRFRKADSGHLAIDDTGRFFKATPDFSARWANGQFAASEARSLLEQGILSSRDDALANVARMRAAALRAIAPTELDYLILVPTLRCNLSCSYCQVSRADENSVRHDWSEETLSAAVARAAPESGQQLATKSGHSPLSGSPIRRYRFAHVDRPHVALRRRFGTALRLSRRRRPRRRYNALRRRDADTSSGHRRERTRWLLSYDLRHAERPIGSGQPRPFGAQ